MFCGAAGGKLLVAVVNNIYTYIIFMKLYKMKSRVTSLLGLANAICAQGAMVRPLVEQRRAEKGVNMFLAKLICTLIL